MPLRVERAAARSLRKSLQPSHDLPLLLPLHCSPPVILLQKESFFRPGCSNTMLHGIEYARRKIEEERADGNRLRRVERASSFRLRVLLPLLLPYIPHPPLAHNTMVQRIAFRGCGMRFMRLRSENVESDSTSRLHSLSSPVLVVISFSCSHTTEGRQDWKTMNANHATHTCLRLSSPDPRLK